MEYDIQKYRHLIVALSAWIVPPIDPTKYTPMAEVSALNHGFILPTCFCTAEWSNLMKMMRHEYRFVEKWNNAIKNWGFNACIDQAKYQADVFPIDRQDPCWFPSGEPLFFPYNQYVIIQARNPESIYKMVLRLCNHFLSPSVLTEARNFILEYAEKGGSVTIEDIEIIRNPYIRIPLAYELKKYPRCPRDLMRIIWYAGHKNIHFRNIRNWKGDIDEMQKTLLDIDSYMYISGSLYVAAIKYKKFLISLKKGNKYDISRRVNKILKRAKVFYDQTKPFYKHVEYPWLSKKQLSWQFDNIYFRNHNFTDLKLYTNKGRSYIKDTVQEGSLRGGLWNEEEEKLRKYEKNHFFTSVPMHIASDLDLYHHKENNSSLFPTHDMNITDGDKDILIYAKGSPETTHANIYITSTIHQKNVRQLYLAPGQVYIIGLVSDGIFIFIGETIKEKIFKKSLPYYFAWRKIFQY